MIRRLQGKGIFKTGADFMSARTIFRRAGICPEISLSFGDYTSSGMKILLDKSPWEIVRQRVRRRCGAIELFRNFSF
jgi:hypothetical protein